MNNVLDQLTPSFLGAVTFIEKLALSAGKPPLYNPWKAGRGGYEQPQSGAVIILLHTS
ncbi:hypothetical protein H633G_11392 [Metarhizium anisopliae BRIP 53284]|nr:hypothetical protein H633G_11392 [Metarhizium anisopliae BRIP 53284]